MAIDLVIQWEGVGAPSYARRFRTAASINDFSPVLRQIAVLAIAPAIMRNFEEGGRPKWEPLQQQTIERKMRQGFHSPQRILVASGAMMDSATNAANYTISPLHIEATPGPRYWIFHQGGIPGRLPQRVMMNLQVGDQRKVGGLFDKFIADHLARHGLKVRGVVTNVGTPGDG